MALSTLCSASVAAHGAPSVAEVAAEEHSSSPPAADFRGMGYMFPLRLKLVYGGAVEGRLGGVDPAAREVLLVRTRRSFRVHFSLIDSVIPLATLLPEDELGKRPDPPPISAQQPLELRWRPTWRSHLGAVMSFILPGTGQFIQKDQVGVGVLFLVSDVFFVTAAVLAFVGPSQMGPSARRSVGGTFVALALSTSILSSVHAFRAGRTQTRVSVHPQ